MKRGGDKLRVIELPRAQQEIVSRSFACYLADPTRGSLDFDAWVRRGHTATQPTERKPIAAAVSQAIAAPAIASIKVLA